jgi:putative two-component system response regulator
MDITVGFNKKRDQIMNYAHESLILPAFELIPPVSSPAIMQKEIAEMHERPRILIVDDEADICALLIRYLADYGYECIAVNDAKEAVEQINRQSPDLAITDISMPGMDGIGLLHEIKNRDDSIPVVMMTGNDDPLSVIDALKMGADDYILKPFDLPNIANVIGNLLKRRTQRKQIQSFQHDLERMLEERTSQVQRLFISIIQSLIAALEQKDPYTNGHSQRVAWISVNLAKETSMIPRDIELVHIAGVFHDIGKIGIPESILAKNGALTKEEYLQVQNHCDIGVRILEPLKELKEILPLVRHHHERYDGCGYPLKLFRAEIPLGARILAIADSFDAMISARPYRGAIAIDEAMKRLVQAAGSQFDPDLVPLFIRMAESGKFLEMLHSPSWTHHDGTDAHKGIHLGDNPLNIVDDVA